MNALGVVVVMVARGAAQQAIERQIRELHGLAVDRHTPWRVLATELRRLAERVDEWDETLSEAAVRHAEPAA